MEKYILAALILLVITQIIRVVQNAKTIKTYIDIDQQNSFIVSVYKKLEIFLDRQMTPVEVVMNKPPSGKDVVNIEQKLKEIKSSMQWQMIDKDYVSDFDICQDVCNLIDDYSKLIGGTSDEKLDELEKTFDLIVDGMECNEFNKIRYQINSANETLDKLIESEKLKIIRQKH